jgi:hypothetical protein
MTDYAAQLRAMHFTDAQIAAARCHGKPLALADEKAKPHKLDGMNKTEAAYAAHLDWLTREGFVRSYLFGSVKLRLARKTWYTPDFFVVYRGHYEFVEVKGFLRDDAAAKFKIAREMYPFAMWRMVKREGGRFVEMNI